MSKLNWFKVYFLLFFEDFLPVVITLNVKIERANETKDIIKFKINPASMLVLTDFFEISESPVISLRYDPTQEIATISKITTIIAEKTLTKFTIFVAFEDLITPNVTRRLNIADKIKIPAKIQKPSGNL